MGVTYILFMFFLPKTVQYEEFVVNVFDNIYIIKSTVPKYYGIHTGWILVRLVGSLQLPSKEDDRVSGISEPVMCTVKYCTVDSIANAKLSILVRPMSHV